MFTRIQTRAFRSLKAVNQPLGRFRALVGPNASGKTTFLDVIGFLGDLVRTRGDVLGTVQARSATFEKLVWMGQGRSFQLAVEANIPEGVRQTMAPDKQCFTRVRYEVEVGLEDASNEVGLNYETLWLMKPLPGGEPGQRDFFPELRAEMGSILVKSGHGRKVAITKKPGRNDNYYTEGKKSYMPSFKLGRGKSALVSAEVQKETFVRVQKETAESEYFPRISGQLFCGGSGA